MSLASIALREERSAILAWSIALLLYMLLVGSSYAAVRETKEFEQVWKDLPEGFREAFGGATDVTSVHGYTISRVSAFPLLLGLYALFAGTKRLAGAEESGALDHLLARPVSRNRFYGGAAAACGVALLLVLAGALVGTLLGFVVSGLSAHELLGVAGAVADIVPMIALWWGVGLLVGAAFHRRGPALGAGLGVLLGTYALHVALNVADRLEWLSYLNPFGYYQRSDLFHGSPDPLYWFLLPVVGGAAAWVGLGLFARKDLFA